MTYVFLALAFTLNAVANILFKLGSERGFDLGSYAPLTLLSNNWQFLLGLALFALNVVFYFLALRALPLSVAYPIMVAMSFLIINGFAFVGLHEPISLLQVVGYLGIILSLMLIVSAHA